METNVWETPPSAISAEQIEALRLAAESDHRLVALPGDNEVDWEYGYNTGSTVTFVGDRSQIEEWALVRGMAVGSGDWGSRIVRRVKAGPWIEAAS